MAELNRGIDSVFTDERGRRMAGRGSPAPPGQPPDHAAKRMGIRRWRWIHPSGERWDPHGLHFNSPPNPN